MSKVYCNLCIHIAESQICCHQSNKIYKDTWYRKNIEYKEEPSKLNENNDCPNFQDK